MKNLDYTDFDLQEKTSLPITQWSALISSSTGIQCASTRLLAAQLDLSIADAFSLMLIHSLPKLSTGELAFFLSSSSGKTTQLLDRLEKQGWIQRSKAPDDRRVNCLSLAPERLAEFEQAQDRAWAELFASTPPQDPNELRPISDDLVLLATLLRSQK